MEFNNHAPNAMKNASGKLLGRLPSADWVFGLAWLVLLTGLLVPETGRAQDLQGSSLTAAERSKLDGRFERVVRKAQDKELQSAIQKMEELAQQVRAQTRKPDVPELGGERAAGQFQGGDQPEVLREEAQGSLRNLPMDVRPDGRTADGTPIYSAIVKTESPSTLQALGATIISTFDGFVTARATPSGLQALVQSDAVTKVRSPRVAKPHNDVGAAEVGARTLNSGTVNSTEYQGEGTMVCIIDSGIDWSHPDFTDENGNTRIQAIWDQVDDSTSVNTPAENDPSRFRQNFNPDYGSEYIQDDIQAALDGSGSVNQQDVNGHGTHVAGTAASSGEAYEQTSGTDQYKGAAPKADIIAVKAGDRSFSSVNYVNGIAYCQDVAEAAGKPVVVNMSLGGDFGPHDGSAPRARAVGQLSSTSGAATVTSAGNSGSPNSPIHTATSLSAGDSVDVGIDVTQYTPNPGEQNDFYFTTLWAYQPGPYEVSVYTPEKQDTLTVTIDGSQQVRDTSVATPNGSILLESSVSGNGRYFQLVAFDAAENLPPAEGQWTMRIRQNGERNTPVHGWFLSSRLGSGDTAGSASFSNADNRFTVGIPATAEGVIAVGNYFQRARWTTSQGESFGFSGLPKGVINPSSSRGPTVDGRTKPDIAAPGSLTPSALSDDASAALGSPGIVGDGEHQLLQGTSMSAPLTAGSVALLMQEQPSFSTGDVRPLLRETARTDQFVEARGVPSQTFGAGKLNVERALSQLTSGSEDAPFEILAYNQPVPFDAIEPVTLGSEGAERAALRFTPTQEGVVSGAYISLSPNTQQGPANELDGPLRVEVWSDDGGVPGSQIGESVAVASSALRGFSPTFVDLSGIGAPVEPGQDYHIVAYPEEGSGSLDLLAETTGPTAERSATFDGNSWSGTGSDLVVRAQVSGNVESDAPDGDVPPIAPVASSPQQAGSEFWVDVRVGSDEAPVSDLFGTSFRLDYDESVLSVTDDEAGDFLGSDVVYSSDDDATAGEIGIGVSRKSGAGGVDGSGVVARVRFEVGEDVPDGTSLPFSLLEVEADNPEGDSIALDPRSLEVTVRQGLAVWPGDTNNDGEVDQADVLPLGQYWGTTGPARDSKTCQWSSYTVEPWSPEAATYADANGDGEVDQADVLCIGQNWGRSHSTEGGAALAKQGDGPQGAVRLRPAQVSGREAWLEISVEGTGPMTGASAALSFPAREASVLSVQPGPAVGSDAIFESNVDGQDGTIALGTSRKNGTVPEGGILARVKMRFEESSSQASSVTVQEATAGLKSGRLLSLEGRRAAMPGEVALEAPSPNPVHSEAQVQYALPETRQVRLVLYNALGQEVKTLVTGTRQAGRHRIQLETSELASGLYFLRLKVEETAETRKVTVIQ